MAFDLKKMADPELDESGMRSPNEDDAAGRRNEYMMRKEHRKHMRKGGTALHAACLSGHEGTITVSCLLLPSGSFS